MGTVAEMGHLLTAASAPAPRLTSRPCRIVPRAFHELMVKVMDEVVADAAPRRYCRRMSAASIEAHRLPPVPHTPAGIRALLPADQAAEFDKAWAGLDLDDLAAVAKFRDDWWCRAAIATDPDLLAGLGDDEPLHPSPLR